MRVILIVINFFICILSVHAQVFINKDTIIDDRLRSVKWHITGNELTLATAPLNGGGLTLTFDKMDQNFGDYFVSVIHCGADWSPSTLLSELEYTDGINRALIRNVSASFNTLVPYTHYEINLPNDELRWTLSGNYLLTVYDRDNYEAPVLVRRFVVFEPLMQTVIRNVRPANAEKTNTYQEADFSVKLKGTNVRNPKLEIQATVLNNKRWDTAISGLRPVFLRTDELDFDFQDKVVFPSWKEFRFFNIQSLIFALENVANLKRIPEGTEVMLINDKPTTYGTYLFRRDINGQYVIKCRDTDECATNGDYGFVNFRLKIDDEIEGKEVYVTGAFCDWQLKEENRMVYQPEVQTYATEIILKQGYYEYQYTLLDSKTGERDDAFLQGTFGDAENLITVLVYYKPFGERYDRCISIQQKDARSFN